MDSRWQANSAAELSLIVAAPLRERGFRTISCPLDDALLAAVAELRRSGAIPADAELRDRLAALGLIAPAGQLPETVRFAPALDASWPALLPYAARERARRSPGLRLHPHLSLGLPPGFPGDLWPEQAPALWAPPLSGGECALPLCPTAELTALLAAVSPAADSAAPLPPALTAEPLRSVLAAAGVLIPPTVTQLIPRLRESLALTLASRGYALLRRVLRPLHAAGLRQYLRQREAEGYFQPDTNQVELRDLLKNDRLLSWLHHQLTALLNQLLPEPVKPSYNLIAIYRGGAELRPHTDRSQCAWNVSLALDMAPEPEPAQSWPICFEQAGKRSEVRLEIGDLVLYRGTDTPHWRPPLPRGQRQTIGLFHFVPLDFSGSLD